MKKRGISAVVATILIILITVAAVTIIWMAILPLVNQRIGIDEANVRLDIVTSGGYTVYDNDTKLFSVQVKRGPGGEVEVDKVKIIINFGGDSDAEVKPAPGPNELRTYVFNLSSRGVAPTSVKVAPVFLDGGVLREGRIISEAVIVAGKMVNIPDPADIDQDFGNESPPCTDVDGDGSCIPSDCDDNNTTIYPGATEDCVNTVDDDCDGNIDMADPDCIPSCTDVDSDGYNFEGGGCGAADCDDGNDTIYPGAIESCFDTVDNDCDLDIDFADADCDFFGLVSWWKFDNDATDSIGSNDGILPSEAVFVNDPERGWVLDLIGTSESYMNVTDDSSLSPQAYGDATWSAWIKKNETGGSTPQYIFSKSSGFDSEYGFSIYNDDTLYAWSWSDRISPPFWHAEINPSSGTISSGQWNHVAFVWDNGVSFKIYINGVLSGEDTLFDGNIKGDTSTLLMFGRPSYNALSGFLNSSIDNAMIFDKALNDTEIGLVMNA